MILTAVAILGGVGLVFAYSATCRTLSAMRGSTSGSSTIDGSMRTSRTAACRTGGNVVAKARAASGAPGPLMRMRAIAAGGRPLDSAKIVAWVTASP